MKSLIVCLVAITQFFLAVQSRAVNTDVSIVYDVVELDKYKNVEKREWEFLGTVDLDVNDNNIFKRMALEDEEEFQAKLKVRAFDSDEERDAFSAKIDAYEDVEDKEDIIDEIPNEYFNDKDRLLKRATVKSSAYFRSQLDSLEKKIYDRLNDISKDNVDALKFRLQNLRSENADKNKALEHAARAIGAVVRDHPEYWWIKQFSLSVLPSGRKIDEISVNLPASYSVNSINKYNEEVERKAKSIADEAAKQGSVYKKLMYIHDYLAQYIKYTDNAEYSFNLFGALLKNACVCEGYAEAFAYISRMLNIPAICVTSTTHKWNYVYLKPDWYAVDVTFDDPSINGYTPAPGETRNISHKFFLVGRDTPISGGKTYSTYSDRDVVTYVEFAEAKGFKFPRLASQAYQGR